MKESGWENFHSHIVAKSSADIHSAEYTPCGLSEGATLYFWILMHCMSKIIWSHLLICEFESFHWKGEAFRS